MARRVPRVEHATLTDVAAAAGVSRATAARALGGYGSVSDDARALVEEAATSLGYHPNTLARSMITGTTQTIGVVVADIELSFFARAVRGIADSAKAHGFEVILANSDEDLAMERAAIGVLLEKRVDGLIVAPAAPHDAGHLANLVQRGIPLVLLDRGAPGIPTDAVVVDNVRAVHNAVSHLARLGHWRIAIVSENSANLTVAQLADATFGPGDGMASILRLAGWASGLRSGGLPLADDLLLGTGYSREQARATTAAALAMDDPPTAIVTVDETMTLGAVDAIMAAGLRMPDDISLVTFDDLQWSTLVRPPLTVVAQPVYELGMTATQRLLDRLAGDERPPETIVLDTSFVLRGSTGPVPTRGPRPGGRPRPLKTAS
jgi:LacI family transcriptional regulator